MKSEDWVSTALRALADQDREREAPDYVEVRLLEAFRRKQARRKLTTVTLTILAAAAGLAVVFVAGSYRRPPVVPVRPPEQLVAAAPAPVEIEPVAERKLPRPVRPARQIVRQTREVMTEFFPLLDVSMPFERGELLRMTVPASTMRKVGLPVNEERLADRVTADVLVGEEGIARAIRFVSYEQ